MPTALVISPHLDDAAFSCGGTMALLADAGWRVCLVTMFTRSVTPATGFALACQLDKGLDAAVDYMELRRQEDRRAADILGVAALRWLDLPEAPHRGYETPAALFGPVRETDDVWRDVAGLIEGLMRELTPDLVLGPQGLGNHVDHHQVIRAMQVAANGPALAYYRDTPYAIRNTRALPCVTMTVLPEVTVRIAGGLERKVLASCAYASQVGFQFGGTDAAAAALRRFAASEGAAGNAPGAAAERFLGQVPQLLH